MHARLVQYGGNRLVRQFVLQGSVTTVGRQVGNSIQLTDRKVSKRHAVIRDRRDGAYEIEDAGSQNGVFVNGKQVKKPVRLRNRDEVRFGPVAFVFEISASPSGWAGAHVIDASPNEADVTLKGIDMPKKRGFFGLGK